MTPDFKIISDNRDITERIKKRFVSLSYSDHSGFQNDRLTIVLDDRPPHVALSSFSTNLEFWLGYNLDDPEVPENLRHFVKMGSFYVDELTLSKSPAKTLTVIARANDTGGTLKAVKTRSWDNTNYGYIIDQIAREHNLEPRVPQSIRDIGVVHLDQSSQSDQGFLTSQAIKLGAVFKVVDDLLYFAPRGVVDNANGAIPVVEIYEGDIETYDMTSQQRSDHSSVTMRHYDIEQGEELVETQQSESTNNLGVELQVDEIAPTQEEAIRASQAKSGQLNREKETFNFSMVGHPLVRAEARVRILNIRPEVRDLWLVKSATHTYSRSGYKITVNCETPTE